MACFVFVNNIYLYFNASIFHAQGINIFNLAKNVLVTVILV